MCAALIRPSCHGETLPMCYWPFYSPITEDYTALETGLFGEKNKCLCSVCCVFVRVRACVCGACMYLLVNAYDIQTLI